jgi:hypothetical protein
MLLTSVNIYNYAESQCLNCISETTEWGHRKRLSDAVHWPWRAARHSAPWRPSSRSLRGHQYIKSHCCSYSSTFLDELPPAFKIRDVTGVKVSLSTELHSLLNSAPSRYHMQESILSHPWAEWCQKTRCIHEQPCWHCSQSWDANVWRRLRYWVNIFETVLNVAFLGSSIDMIWHSEFRMMLQLASVDLSHCLSGSFPDISEAQSNFCDSA